MLAVLAVVLTHAHVLTMAPAQPVATTLAIVDGKLAYVGDDEAAARRAAGAGAEILDVGGRTVVPGFEDAHVHFGLSITTGGPRGIDVPELPKKAWLAAVADGARARPGRDWLFVVTPALPDGVARAADLDFLGRPVFVVTKRGGLLNHRAAALCRLGDGEAPRGFIRGRELPAALDRAVKAQPRHLLLDEARDFMAELSRLGLTSVQLIAYDELPEIFETLRNEGTLSARVRMVPVGYRFGDRIYHSNWQGPAPDWVRVDGVKYYHDDWARISRLELQAIFDDVTGAGRHVVLHVLSRRALVSFLDAIERMAKAQPDKARLFRVDHADEVTREDAERLARDGIMVCSNPSMIPEWHNEHAFPMRTLVAAGVKLCLGTDWLGRHTPARPLAPLSSLQLAVTHGGFGSAERLTAAEALEAYTVGSATSEGMETKKGALQPGLFADLVVLSADPTAVAPEKIGEIEVVLTMVGGRVVYRRGGFGAPPPSSIGPRPTNPPPTIGPPKPPASKKR
jgi:predicted amidohydrolase YtcJ